jgi:hypothetical protein
VDPGAPHHPLVEHVEALDLADLGAHSLEGFDRLGEQPGPVEDSVATHRVERSGEQRVGARRLEQRHGAVDHRVVEQLALAEVEDGRLREAAEDLVDRGVDEVGAGLDRRLR